MDNILQFVQDLLLYLNEGKAAGIIELIREFLAGM